MFDLALDMRDRVGDISAYMTVCNDVGIGIGEQTVVVLTAKQAGDLKKALNNLEVEEPE